MYVDVTHTLVALLIGLQVLSLFAIRSEICGNIQRIREIHDRFLLQLQNVTPKSTYSEAEITALASQALQKRRSTIDLSGFKGLQNRSLRTRSMKARMNTRVRVVGADPYEALDVAREIDNLVCTPGELMAYGL